MSYLFLVSIGPVQGFIASARRTRDLAFGSWLLSEIAKAAARQIVEIEGRQESLIFPAPDFTQNNSLVSRSPLNVANKIVALIQHAPKDVGKSVKDAIFAQLHSIRDETYKEIKIAVDERETAYKQIEDLIDLQWVAVPFNEEEHKYVAARKQLEALMAARKNTRDFAPVKWHSDQPKSSIDGQLESVIPESAYPSRQVPAEKKFSKIRQLYDKYHAGPAERLSGVDLLKRCGETIYPSDFPSTSHIATIPFLQRLELIPDKTQARERWNNYIEKVRRIADPKGSASGVENTPMQVVSLEKIAKDFYSAHSILQNLEGSMLFEERLTDLVDVISDNDKLKEAKNALRKFYEFTDSQFASLGLSSARPNPYYAILLADGDRMGEVIDAQAEHKIHEDEHGYEQHHRISQALSRFADGVKAIVEKDHKGALVYAGGDDVLAFVPLHTVLRCAQKLAKNFEQILSGFTNNETAKNQKRTPTLSVGIVIVHHLESLQDALELARSAEKKAKQVDGKNALAIIVSKRSGEDYSIAGSWDDMNEYLEQLISFCRADDIPNGTAYELRDLARRLTVPVNDPDFNTLQAAIKEDTKRILHRKLYVPLGKLVEDKAKAVESVLYKRLDIEQKQAGVEPASPVKDISIEQKQASVEPVPPIKDIDMEKFTNELIIAQVLADAQHLANLPEEGEK